MISPSSTTLRRALAVSLVLAGAAAARPPATSAQVSTTRGWSLGAHLVGASLSVEDDDANGGGGLGLRAGYGFNRTVTVFLSVDGIAFDAENAPTEVSGEWTMAHADLGARFHFANALRRWVPWLEAAVGGRTVSLEDEVVDGEEREGVTFTGGSFTVGGGLDVYLRQTLALELGLRFTGGEFTDVEVGNVTVEGLDLDASSVRVGLGLTWWP